MIEVRHATRDDADAMCDVHVASWREGYKHFFSHSLLWADEFESSRRVRWRRWQFEGIRFVGELDGRLVGWVHVGAELIRPDADPSQPQGRGEVHGFYVHPDAWGSGIARALMADAERWFMEHGLVEAILWVLDDNPRGRRFYEKCGWRPTGVAATFDMYCDEPAPEVEYRRTLTNTLGPALTGGVG